MKTIFIVDDNDTNLMAAKTALDGIYKTYGLPSAIKMFKMLERIVPDLILLDVDMPEMNGFEAIRALKSDERLRQIPVVFLTAKQDAASEIQGFEMGALDFINKPFSAPVLIKRIEHHIDTDKLIKDSQKAVRDIHTATISVIADMIEARDKVTGGHIERTQKYLEILTGAMLRAKVYDDILLEWDITLLLPSAQLHDVGKIAISDTILNAPRKLTNEEFEIIKSHCDEGAHIIDRIINKTQDDDFLRHARNFAFTHHEKWDGTGYPQGLKGEEIPLEGRMMAVADVYDALVTKRPYKQPFFHERAVEIMRQDSGAYFDPKIAEVFFSIADDFGAASAAFSQIKWEEA